MAAGRYATKVLCPFNFPNFFHRRLLFPKIRKEGSFSLVLRNNTQSSTPVLMPEKEKPSSF